MDKKRLIVSMNHLPEGVLEAIREKYPDGYDDFVIKVPTSNNGHFYAITVETENANYLVKVSVKIDKKEEKDPVIEEINFEEDNESIGIETDDDYSDDPDDY